MRRVAPTATPKPEAQKGLYDQGCIFEFTLVNSEMTRVDTIPFTISNEIKFQLSRFHLLIRVIPNRGKSIPKLSKFEYSALCMSENA